VELVRETQSNAALPVWRGQSATKTEG
jgi:hypothetical protein